MSGIFNPPRALQVPFNPAGNIVSTNVQAMGEELDAEKVAKSGDTMTGSLNIVNSTSINGQNDGVNELYLNSARVSTATHISFVGRMSYGTIAAPAYIGANNVNLWQLSCRPYDGGTFLTQTGLIQFQSDGVHSGANLGTKMRIDLTANGSITPVTAFSLTVSSGLSILSNTVIDNNSNHVFRRYTVGTVPAAASNAGRGVMVTPTSGNERLYTSNGTNWYDGAGVILS